MNEFSSSSGSAVEQILSQIAACGPEHDCNRSCLGVAAFARARGPPSSCAKAIDAVIFATLEAGNCHPC
eukprot:7680551-Pyramimonas_sp.AAC.1